LIQPEEGALFSNQITVYTPPGLDLAPLYNSQPWVKEQTGMTTNGQQKFYHFSSETKQQQIILRGTLRNKDIQGTTVIDRAWIQTWISHNSRLDRVAYHITSDQPYLTITLPENVQHDRLSVLLNNNPYILNENESLFDTEGNLVIAVDDTLKNKPFVLEISYFIDLNKTTNKWLMDFPRFVNGSVWIRHSYWQVILPSHIHIINDIPGWTAEYINDTEWSDFHWKRVPSMDQQELCSWIGVKQREVIPAETSVYLYSTFNQIQQSRLPVIDRAYLILIGSGLSLIIGLGFLYFPLIRYRGSLLVLILLLISFFTYRPLITFVLLQTTVFGILLTGLTLFFIKIFGKKEAWPQRTPDLINIQETPVNYPSMDIPTSSVPTMTLNDRQEETEIKNPQ
ncbi:MAG: hypothetical protein IKW74_06425, partial [Thermoguttaceae bacterium]|nr:hypothetical protein [Thermoguttaceae bacterium]